MFGRSKQDVVRCDQVGLFASVNAHRRVNRADYYAKQSRDWGKPDWAGAPSLPNTLAITMISTCRSWGPRVRRTWSRCQCNCKVNGHRASSNGSRGPLVGTQGWPRRSHLVLALPGPSLTQSPRPKTSAGGAYYVNPTYLNFCPLSSVAKVVLLLFPPRHPVSPARPACSSAKLPSSPQTASPAPVWSVLPTGIAPLLAKLDRGQLRSSTTPPPSRTASCTNSRILPSPAG
ncbi:uncharacterized protein B0I36DRAFT_155110 [Microdochium trichocladiopsis]|uniref:Uncharacterized protein n=1 Tax=Microdochium trichocladiopsis TaxID=1682393 RepID=A0A9P8Y0D9_9PEZI|nr:uncharacterized protein B0I36DRAFT_155110 [Microdochium trichocladiopsis]KAH7026196.1 hypothetical protein B0I36DRAFT_155110 [Microdochium trichocladiopsis]